AFGATVLVAWTEDCEIAADSGFVARQKASDVLVVDGFELFGVEDAALDDELVLQGGTAERKIVAEEDLRHWHHAPKRAECNRVCGAGGVVVELLDFLEPRGRRAFFEHAAILKMNGGFAGNAADDTGGRAACMREDEAN